MSSNARRSTQSPLVLAIVLSLLPGAAFAQHYVETDLVSNLGMPPVVNDANLKNAWGLVHGPSTPWWVSSADAGLSTVYNASAVPVTIAPLVVTVPNAPSQSAPGSPTAIMFNGSPTDFLLAPDKQATFIWVTEDGTISGWNPGVNATNAVIMVDNSQKPFPGFGAVYKGATIAEIAGRKFILAANFHSGRIDVFDSTFQQLRLSPQAFNDPLIPRGYSPFNVQGIGPNVYVTFAKRDATGHDDVAGAGFGFVDVFSPAGRLLARLQHGPWLNAPWGIVLAPADFGEFSHAILVANFGSGTVAAFNPVTGQFMGNMLKPDNSVLTIDGLWGLGFGNGGPSGPGNRLFFTAGPNDESDGLFGSLMPIDLELNENDEQ